MTPRAREILFSIVKAYIESGEPQGSRTVSRAGGTALSPASIRNTMADLAEEGYLAQPHTSAGRIPTEKAFRAYVSGLQARPLPAPDAQRVWERFRGEDSVGGRVAQSSRILTEISKAVGLVAAVQTGGQELEHVELISLPQKRVLIVVATRDRNVSNRVITLDREMPSEDLASIRNYINWHFTGWLLEDARRELLRRILEEKAAYDAILQHLTLLCDKGLLDTDNLPHVHLEGASNLVGLDLHLTRERMRDLFRALEEKQRVFELLDRFLEHSSGELGVTIGLGTAHPSMKELALVGLSVSLPGGLVARVAVLGPMRMNYGRVMSAVWEIGRAFEKAQMA